MAKNVGHWRGPSGGQVGGGGVGVGSSKQQQQQQHMVTSLTPGQQQQHHHHQQHSSKHQQHPHPQGGQGGSMSVVGVGGGGGTSDELGMLASPNPVMPHHDLENLETCSRNPLFCIICNSVFEDPRLLACYHSFCAKCIQIRTGENKIHCPLCGKVTPLKDGSGPPADHLLRFLLQASADIEPPCANCDYKGRPPMYYCNTCGQALCSGCREETHRAKMFSAHDIIPVSKYAKETPKKCSIHGEQYIMFSTVQKSMLCINCYRDTAMESRLHCVDLETAYSQGCRKLDRAVLSLRDLQVAVRDGITMLKNVLEELRRNSDSEKSAVNAVVQTILDALTKTQENLLRDVDCQMDGKDKVIRGQLAQLRSVLPTIKLHLTMCATVSNAASKYDFLDLAYPLIDRLTAITHMGYPIRPGQSSQIKSNYKAEISRTLEPWISASQLPAAGIGGGGGGGSQVTSGAHPPSSSSFMPSQLPKDYAVPEISLTSMDPTFSEPTYSQYYPMSRSTVTPLTQQQAQQLQQQGGPSGGQQQQQGSSSASYAKSLSLVGGGYAAPAGIGAGPNTSGRKTPVPGHGHGHGSSSKTKGSFSSTMTLDPDDTFSSHCRSFSAHFSDLSQRLNRLKEQVQDLHRDVTLQRGSSYAARAETALREGLFLEDQLARRLSEMERMKKVFESTWNEHIRQVRVEQEVFQSQLNELMALKAEVKQVSSILQQLQSFLKSVGAQHGGGGGGGGGIGGGGAGSSSGGGGGGVGPSNVSGGVGGLQNLQLQGSSTPSARLQQQQQSSTSSHHDNKSYHLSPTSEAGLHSRAESSSQVTPSLAEIAFSKGGSVCGGSSSSKPQSKKESLALGLKSDLSRLSGRFTVTKASLPNSNLPSSVSAAAAAAVSAAQQQQQQQVQQGQGAFAIVPQQQPQQQQHQPHCQLAQPQQQSFSGPKHPQQQQQQQEMEYIQVDTSYTGLHRGSMPGQFVHPPPPHPPSSTSHHPHPLHHPHNVAHHHRPETKRGMLSQLIDKVRSGKDDRKKSCASGVSSSSSGGTIPHPPPPPVPQYSVVSRLSRAPLEMKDSHFQYSQPYPDNSAVAALARTSHSGGGGGNSVRGGHGGGGVNIASGGDGGGLLRRNGSTRSRESTRAVYTRAKSFVKSKSDDERPPTKLSKHSRARSAGALETESLLKALNLEDPKDALRLLTLYQSLSRGLLATERQMQSQRQQQQIQQQQIQQHHQQQQQQQQQHQHQHQQQQQQIQMQAAHQRFYQYMLSDTVPRSSGSGSRGDMMSNVDPLLLPSGAYTGSNSLKYSRSASEAAATTVRRTAREDFIDLMSEDDYQQIPLHSSSSMRSQSAPPRRPPKPAAPGGGPGNGGGGGGTPSQPIPTGSGGSGRSSTTTQVKVHVHEEPHHHSHHSQQHHGGSSMSSRSSPAAAAPLSKSLEEAYLYGFLSDRENSLGRSSSGGGRNGRNSNNVQNNNNNAHHHSSSSQSAASTSTKKPVSCESLISFDSNSRDSRKSSIDFDRRSVVTIRRAGSKSGGLTPRQHSWEGAGGLLSANKQSLSTPQLSPDEFGGGGGTSASASGGGGSGGSSLLGQSGSVGNIVGAARGIFDDDDVDVDRDSHGQPLHKSDSFEGHEEAVRSIVQAVKETRTLQRKMQSN